jgi:hypothetical protein
MTDGQPTGHARRGLLRPAVKTVSRRSGELARRAVRASAATAGDGERRRSPSTPTDPPVLASSHVRSAFGLRDGRIAGPARLGTRTEASGGRSPCATGLVTAPREWKTRCTRTARPGLAAAIAVASASQDALHDVDGWGASYVREHCSSEFGPRAPTHESRFDQIEALERLRERNIRTDAAGPPMTTLDRSSIALGCPLEGWGRPLALPASGPHADIADHRATWG